MWGLMMGYVIGAFILCAFLYILWSVIWGDARPGSYTKNRSVSGERGDPYADKNGGM